MIDFNKLAELLTELQVAATNHAVAAFGSIDAQDKKRIANRAWGAVMQYVHDNMPAAANAPFDEAAARAGKPIEMLIDGVWHPAHFVGTSRQQEYIVESEEYRLVCAPAALLRMAAPKMRTLYLNVYASNIGASGFNKAAIEKCAGPGCAYIAYPVEVPE